MPDGRKDRNAVPGVRAPWTHSQKNSGTLSRYSREELAGPGSRQIACSLSRAKGSCSCSQGGANDAVAQNSGFVLSFRVAAIEFKPSSGEISEVLVAHRVQYSIVHIRERSRFFLDAGIRDWFSSLGPSCKRKKEAAQSSHAAYWGEEPKSTIWRGVARCGPVLRTGSGRKSPD